MMVNNNHNDNISLFRLAEYMRLCVNLILIPKRGIYNAHLHAKSIPSNPNHQKRQSEQCSTFTNTSYLQPRLQSNGRLTLCVRTLIRSWSQLHIICEIELSLWIVVAWQEVNDEIVLDGKDGVCSEVWVVAWEDLGCDWFEVVGCDLLTCMLALLCSNLRV